MPTLEQECNQAVSRLKAALIGLYDDVGADPSSPQDVARAFHINKTLTWNIAKLMQAGEGLAAVPHVPGNSSIERFLKATESHGANSRIVEEVRSATREFERVIDVHVGDRATLDLVIDGLECGESAGLEQSRKRAYIGNSGIYGVQARTNLMSCFLAPNDENPSQLDMVMLRGLLGVRRLRSSVRLPLFQMRQWSSDDQAISTQEWRPIEENSTNPLIQKFNKGDVPEIRVVKTPGGSDYIINPGPIGNRGAFDCYFGDMIRAGASRYRTENDTTGEFGVTVSVPTESIVFDLIVHKSLKEFLETDIAVYAHLFTTSQRESEWDDASQLPIRQSVSRLPGSPPAVAIKAIPGYTDIHQHINDRLGWNAKDFIGTRLEMKYPPLGASVTQKFNLPSQDS
jgi:hypothetical protein